MHSMLNSLLALLFLTAAGFAQAPDLAETRKRAEAGSAHEQCLLGLMYDNGEGVLKDDAEAVKWYRLAAEQGFAPAEFNLGYMYYNGTGVPKNYDEAKKWWRRAGY
jgi:uncharacterized protein